MLLFLLPLCTYGRTLKIGVSHFDPPFVIQLDPTHFDGFDVSMIRYVCRTLRFDCELIAFKRDRLLDEVENGTVDLAVSDLVITDKRASKVNFSIPYLINITHVIGLKKYVKNPFIIDLLYNQKIGITDESYQQHINTLKIKNPIVSLYGQDDEMIDALNRGKIGFAFVDTYTASYWSNNSSDLIEDFGSPLHFESLVAVAVNSKDQTLLEEINRALTQYRNSQQFITDYNKYLLFF
ncbi:transporter substrate-binding domain-containing protein [Legionella bononiensis]|uniref:Transporter substrate-binding domain-containing protein n=1 Tax=Legionella bononiensis TaxID=2793102 RepID=A0ABS1WBZ6_9GAMM|nr:transporter substrate-binding domain-containing protein [Legionella bononiensis]MBL7481167.1 transporter substrate-binding domain-containing protein [Legionella bononiensis]MBL7526876.1 transporter substrate-binding domain-containing protein [Legionella bononiensis]MBL7564283.1 transporter substrate-binding domain-containing protein [Legionella bononiensis]